MNRYSKFWEWFLLRSKYIFDELETDTENIVLEITMNLKKVHNDLEFEIPFDLENGKRSLIISETKINRGVKQEGLPCPAAAYLKIQQKKDQFANYQTIKIRK